MAQRMMWDHILAVYRGQATNGTVVVVEPPAMELAHKKAGRTVYDSDWWVETVQRTLEHWGIYPRRWLDAATHVPRLNYSLTPPTDTGALPVTQSEATTPTLPLNSGPLANKSPFANSGPLSSRSNLPNLPDLNSAPLNSGSLGNGGLLPSKNPAPSSNPAPLNSGPLGSRGLLPNGGVQPDASTSGMRPSSGPLLNRLKSGPLNKDRDKSSG